MTTNVPRGSVVPGQALRRPLGRAGLIERVGSLTIAQRNRLVITLDLVALVAGLWIADAVFDPELGGLVGPASWTSAAFAASAYAGWRVIVDMTDTFEPRSIGRIRPRPFDLATAALVVVGLSSILGVALSTLRYDIGRWALPQVITLVFAVMVAARMAWSRITEPVSARRLLLIGGGQDAHAFEAQIAREQARWHADFRYVEEVPVPEINDERAARTDPLDAVVVGMAGGVGSLPVGTALACAAQGTELVDLSSLYERVLDRVPTSELTDNRALQLRVHARCVDRRRQLSKRIFDVVSASLGLIILAPLLPVVALVIYLDCPGPIFYKQVRVGRFGKHFWVYKLRTMQVDAEPDGPVWAQVNDARITRVGRLLRKAHLDEFPQLVNILKGEMSAVGPRPERPEFVETLSEMMPMYDLRHCVRPGMAGWGLIRQGYGSSAEDAMLKLQYDLYYIQHQSTPFDLGIMLRTITDGITLRGR